MKSLPIFLILFLSTLVHSQTGLTVDNKMVMFSMDGVPKRIFNNSKVKNEIKGSPYLNHDFVKGTIVDKSKSKSQSAFLRYNVLYNVMEIKTSMSSSNIVIIPDKKILEYEIDDKSYVYFKEIPVKGNEVLDGYLVKLFSNENATLFSYPYLKMEVGNIATTGYEKSTPNQIYLAKTFYIFENNHLKEFKFKNNDLNMVMSKLGEEMPVAKIKDEKDLISFLNTK